MNEGKLTSALGMIGEDALVGYFEYRKELAARRKKKVKGIFIKAVIAAVLLLLAFAMLPAMLGDGGEDTQPVPEETTDVHYVIEDTTAPTAVDETTAVETVPDDPYSLSNVLIVESYINASSTSPYAYTTWEGLDISNLLKYGIDRSKNQPDKYLAINVFRRNGDYFYTDYVYEGMTYKELENAILMASHKATLMQYLISKEGEILKYGKEIVTVKGIPTDDPLISDFDKGVRWAESLYDQTVAKYNECDPEMLSRYIVNGDFLSELAESDKALFEEEYKALRKKMSEMNLYYFQRHEAGDLALFESLGFNAGEINGKLYIFATFEQLLGLAGRADMSAFSFTPLPRSDYLDAYPVSDLPDDYKTDRTVGSFALDKIVFENLRAENERTVNVYVSTDEEFYCALDETIRKYKRGDLYIELQFYAKNDKGNRYCIDISELEGLKYSGYYVSKYSFLTAVKLRFEDFNDPEIMACLRDLSLREEITRISITQRMYVG